MTVVGHVNIDVILNVKEIPSFGSEEVNETRRELGGTGANIALQSARLGVPLTLITRISQKFPKELIGKLKNKKIELVTETSSEEGPICYIADTRESQIAFMYQGPMNKPGRAYHIKSKYCHFATSNPTWILRLMDKCDGVKVLDPGQEIKYRWNRSLLERAVSKADLLILNEDEFNYLSSIVPLKGKQTIVTVGDRGAILDGELIKTNPVIGRSTLGAGDTFRGALYASLFRGKDLREAVGCANHITGLYLEYGLNFLKKVIWKGLC